LFCSRFFVARRPASLAFCKNFANKLAKLLHLGIKKERVLFVLHSIFCNFDFVEVMGTRKRKEKKPFSFALLSFFSNFAPKL